MDEAQRQRRRRSAVLVPILGAVVPLAAMLWAGRPWQRLQAPADLAMLAALIGFGLLAYAIAALVLIAARTVRWLWWSVLSYAVIIGVAGIVMDLLIMTADSSTAAIGFVVVPFYQLAGLPLVLIIGGILALLIRARQRRPSPA